MSFDDDSNDGSEPTPESAAASPTTTPPPADTEEPETFLSTDDPALEVLLPVSELAKQAGVDIPTLPEGAGVAFTESALADFLNWSLDEGLNKAAIGSVLEMYATWLTTEARGLTGRAVERPGDEALWRERLATAGLNPKQIARLISWHRACS